MRDDDRRRRFRTLLDEVFKGDRARLMRDAELSKGRITQLLDPEWPFGERAAHRLVSNLNAKGYGLPEDYFDARPNGNAHPVPPPPDALSADERDLLHAFRTLDEEDQAQVLAQVWTQAERVNRLLQRELLRRGIVQDGGQVPERRVVQAPFGVERRQRPHSYTQGTEHIRKMIQEAMAGAPEPTPVKRVTRGPGKGGAKPTPARGGRK